MFTKNLRFFGQILHPQWLAQTRGKLDGTRNQPVKDKKTPAILPTYIPKGVDFSWPYIHKKGFELVGGNIGWLIPERLQLHTRVSSLGGFRI
jgi:hypothetical protein